MKETKLNKRLLRKVRNRIAKIPESYAQNVFYKPSGESPCGTAACIAGETIIVAAGSVSEGIKQLRRLSKRFDEGLAWDHPAAKKAQKLLGLSWAESDCIFSGDAGSWPEPYRSRFQRAARPATQAKAAVAYLDECLKRGKVTW